MSSHEHGQEGPDTLADVSEETARMRALAREILKLEGDQPISGQMIQEGLTSLTKLYAVSHERGERSSPFTRPRDMPATAAMILVTAVLEAVNVEPFELGMWKAWSGASRP